MVLHAVPKANKMIANKNHYSENERFAYAKWIINYMRKHARTRTKVYGRENMMHWELFLHRKSRVAYYGGRNRQKGL